MCNSNSCLACVMQGGHFAKNQAVSETYVTDEPAPKELTGLRTFLAENSADTYAGVTWTPKLSEAEALAYARYIEPVATLIEHSEFHVQVLADGRVRLTLTNAEVHLIRALLDDMTPEEGVVPLLDALEGAISAMRLGATGYSAPRSEEELTA